jgi:hypothetical protein
VRERLAIVIPLLALGWLGGALGVGLVDPGTVNHLSAALEGRGGDRERQDALGAGGESFALGLAVFTDRDRIRCRPGSAKQHRRE